MKLFNKLNWFSQISLDSIFQNQVSGLTGAQAFLGYCWQNVEKITRRLCNLFFLNQAIRASQSKSSEFSQTFNHTLLIPIRKSYCLDWAPLIKTTGSPNHNIDDSIQSVNYNDNPSLTEQSVLCVGGRCKFYPTYRKLIENSGGTLITFYGDSNDHLEHLHSLLEKTDAIICPIDCVNHEAFLMVKRYCASSLKRCVLLDRSEINTFRHGIHLLASLRQCK